MELNYESVTSLNYSAMMIKEANECITSPCIDAATPTLKSFCDLLFALISHQNIIVISGCISFHFLRVLESKSSCNKLL